MRSVRVIIPYFGAWPEWFPLYLHSCARNPTFHFLFYTDQAPPECAPDNVKFERTSFDAYARRVSSVLGIRFSPADPYKLCDIRPALGAIHASELAGYDNFGSGDIDVFYGNLRKHYPDALLEKLLVSTHSRWVSGHFCVLENSALGRNLFRLVPLWQRLLENPKYTAFEDRHFTRLFLGMQPHTGRAARAYRFANPLYRRSSFVERYTTPFSRMRWADGSDDHPRVWYFRAGEITNDVDGERTFPYLHFMNYKSGRYLPLLHGIRPAWSGLSRVVQLSEQQALREGWAISARGIVALPGSRDHAQAAALAS
ncbi:MAG TPA: DUF6625 family protein [Polyangiales bacterium]|nr:DUF6625 family protein [Polyangiales bacterium]